MKGSRVDWLPIAVILVAGALGSNLFTRLIGANGDAQIVQLESAREVSSVVSVVKPFWNEDGTHVRLEPSPIRVTVEEGSSVRINGTVAVDPEPLIYIDGVRLDGSASIDDIEPSSIERVEIVKDQAAIELFGDEAVGGVVQIFLKRPESGRR